MHYKHLSVVTILYDDTCNVKRLTASILNSIGMSQILGH